MGLCITNHTAEQLRLGLGIVLESLRTILSTPSLYVAHLVQGVAHQCQVNVEYWMTYGALHGRLLGNREELSTVAGMKHMDVYDESDKD